ncbi:MAG: phosphoenolpyruvate--protein phosphotransferase [Deltaproteobacteria bacterium]|nr:phosphoenolpyruvate--protein phosphotransferase [Deltaproteobacteria bacterium]
MDIRPSHHRVVAGDEPRKMLELRGRPVSPGLTRGRAYIIGGDRMAVPHYRVAATVTAEERRRLESALQSGAEDLARLQERVQAELGRPEAEIFDAHRALLSDEQFRERICAHIDQQQVNAEWAVETTVKDIADSLESADNEYLRERAADVRDLGHRVLRHLSDDERRPHAYLPADSILVARELFPLDLMEIDRAHLAGIVTERGGATGHAAILARALAIPAITGVADATSVISPGAELLVDGGSGVVTVDPPTDEAERFSSKVQRYDQGQAAAEADEGLVAETLDGATVGLYANIARGTEAQDAVDHRLDGVGLFRTEYLFLNEPDAPSFEKHRAAYEDAARRLDGRPLVIRTLDLGGDKFPRFLDSHREENPMLGLRGLRFSLTEGRTLFETQIQAILAVAASHREVRILLPMVLGAADFGAARSIIEKLARDEHLRERPKIGAMIETPAAVLTIHDILDVADFASIGTNDLTQFILAADRNAFDVIEHHTVLHPAVLRAIKLVAEAGEKAGKAISVCGEAAANPAVAGLLIGLGIRQLSMSPAASAWVRQRIRTLDSREAETLAERALKCTDAELVRMAIWN